MPNSWAVWAVETAPIMADLGGEKQCLSLYVTLHKNMTNDGTNSVYKKYKNIALKFLNL